MSQNCYRWGITNIQWNNANWLWSECQLVQEILTTLQPSGPDATVLIQPWLDAPWNPFRAGEVETNDKRRRLIKLICKVKDVIYTEEKKAGDMVITANDIRMVVKKVSGIDLKIK